MIRAACLLVATVLACAFVAGCGAGAPGAEDRRTITLWHAYADEERAALETLAGEWNQAHPEVKLELVGVPYDAFSDKLTSAIPNGNGPDLFIFAHDRIGDWAEAGLVEPIEFWVDDALADRFDLAAVAAMAYRGSLYGLPLAVKSVALFYRTDLVSAPPRTTDELLAFGRRFTDGKGRFGLAYENTKLYGHAPWLHGFGGVVFDDEGAPRLASAEARAAAAFARELGGPDGIVPAECTGTLMATLFNEGRVPLAVSGPWFMGGLAPGVPWAVARLPVVSATGKPAAPFLGAEGVMISARGKHKRDAFLVAEFLTGDAAAILRARRARQVVPNKAAYKDPTVAADGALSAFRAQAEVAVPMPSIPAMRMVWTPYDTALQKVVAQGAEPGAALESAERELEGYVAGSRRR